MPVQRFRDFDEARRALWADAGDPELSRRIRRLWAFSARLVSRRAPRGVRRFRTLEDACRDRSAWETHRPGRG
jgi:hypothetical protein